VCAKILELVAGRSIAANSLEDSGMVVSIARTGDDVVVQVIANGLLRNHRISEPNKVKPNGR
jgi:hypothetical protein